MRAHPVGISPALQVVVVSPSASVLAYGLDPTAIHAQVAIASRWMETFAFDVLLADQNADPNLKA
eukprot:COSAG01_NODE_66962_length_268_cov_0.923077_1_plen_64_part_01